MNLLIQKFINHALPTVEAAPVRDRADLYEALSILLKKQAPKAAAHAHSAADALRKAESEQLIFRNLMEAES